MVVFQSRAALTVGGKRYNTESSLHGSILPEAGRGRLSSLRRPGCAPDGAPTRPPSRDIAPSSIVCARLRPRAPTSTIPRPLRLPSSTIPALRYSRFQYCARSTAFRPPSGIPPVEDESPPNTHLPSFESLDRQKKWPTLETLSGKSVYKVEASVGK